MNTILLLFIKCYLSRAIIKNATNLKEEKGFFLKGLYYAKDVFKESSKFLTSRKSKLLRSLLTNYKYHFSLHSFF